VAVKVVSKKKLSDEDLAALHTEIKILTKLNHPHIIKSVPSLLFPWPF
jgi:serine/threonine protein kinase